MEEETGYHPLFSATHEGHHSTLEDQLGEVKCHS